MGFVGASPFSRMAVLAKPLIWLQGQPPTNLNPASPI